ncbi:hypothetical protein [Algibacter lectus]|uniref:hypothetical protein n=1 Tax=Algibacter lectus TaxID=221126 RepID=UPI0026EEA33A|nr:hypothetical protein [Algibacter lectus]MDO7135741.1 hypothetical protein [Algibacter lectus]
MDEQNVIAKFVELSEGKLTAEGWGMWFSENTQSVEKICGKRYFLKIKPKNSFSEIRNVYHGQTAVSNWLKSKNIEVSLSNIYKKNYDKEFDVFCKEQDEKRKNLKKSVETNFGYLKEIYPKLLRQLTKSYDEYTKIEAGKSIKEIEIKEKELSLKFSDELKALFNHISVFEYEGIEINFNYLEKQLFDKKEFLILGEFWQYGDGDKLLYDIDNGNVFVFAQEYNPPKVVKQAQTITEFIEKKIVRHLKEYEE